MLLYILYTYIIQILVVGIVAKIPDPDWIVKMSGVRLVGDWW